MPDATWLGSELLWTAFLACLVLVAIHSYLGLHVLERGVIFVDLALAQIAALGAMIALLVAAHPLECALEDAGGIRPQQRGAAVQRQQHVRRRHADEAEQSRRVVADRVLLDRRIGRDGQRKQDDRRQRQ